MMILMRGISGSGKSFLAKKLQSVIPNSVIHSTDSYFMVDGVYGFKPEKLGYYHKCNQEAVVRTLEAGKIPIVDNTNTTWKEVQTYLELAKLHNVLIVEPINDWSANAEECCKRNQHGVPLEAVTRMSSRFASEDEICKNAASIGANVTYIKMKVV